MNEELDLRPLAHLLALVQQHNDEFGDPHADGTCILEWQGGEGWWLSIVMPGHYAFERFEQPDAATLLSEAVAYYGGGVSLWDDDRGCRQHHPYTTSGDSSD